MNNVGFELYCQIVKEEVDRLKGIPVQEDINVLIELPLSSYIPKNFIRSERERINIYRVLGSLKSGQEADLLVKEIYTKRGELPETLRNLVDIAKIKCIAKKASIEQVIFSKNRGVLFRKITLPPEKAKPLISKYPNFIYSYRNREILFKNLKKELTAGLVLKYLDDIIAFI